MSCHDFLAHEDTRGILRVFCNVFGTASIIIGVTVMQPMHKAWCCYGEGREIWEEQLDGHHFTCEEWAKFGHPESYFNNPTFPNGDCMKYNSIGLLAFWTTLFGISLILLSLSLWVFAFVAAGDACERGARRFFRAVLPEQRFLVIQIMDWLGIKHGKLKLY